MASIKELEDALKNADKAGDAPAARILADEIVKLRSNASPAFSSTIPGKNRLSTDAELWAANHPVAAGAATFLRGVPFIGEYMDEGIGKLAPAMGPNSAEKATEVIRGGADAFTAENPKTAFGLGMGGAVTGAGMGMAALPAAIPAAMPISMGGRVLAGAGIGAGLGGTEGAISGYGSGTDDATRGQNAQTRGLIGAGLGTVLGTAAPIIGKGVEKAGRKLLDAWTISKKATAAGLSKPSYEILTRAMEADQSFGGPGWRRLYAGGNDAMLADARRVRSHKMAD